jgi:peroxiredoxin
MTNVLERQSIGCFMPDFILPLLDGGSLSPQSFLAGRKAAVVVFWSGICSHCRRYDDYLNRLPERYPGVGLLAVASRQNESVQMLRATVAERGLRFPMVHDADRAVAQAWLVSQTPRVFLLDPQCRLLYRGAIDNFKYPQDPEFVPYLDTAIEALLAGKTPPRPETPSFGCPVESVYYTMPKP